METASRSQVQSAILRANLSNETVGWIVVGPLLALYANDVLGLSAERIALILALAPLVACLRFPLLGWVDRVGWVRLLRLGALLRIAVIVVMAAMPAAWLSLPMLVGLVLAFLAARELSFNTIWQPLLRAATDDADRGRFFARMRASFFTVSALSKAAIAGVIGSRLDDGEYKGLLVLAALGLLSHWWFLRQVPEPAHLASGGEPWTAARLLRVAAASRLLRRPLLVQILCALASMPLLVVYFRQVLHLPTGLVTLYTAVATVGTVASLLLWGRIADALGYRPLLLGMLVLSVVAAPLPLLLAPYGVGDPVVAAAVLTGMALIDGALSAGIGIAMTSLNHHLTKVEDATGELGLFAVALGLVTAAVTFAAGWFVGQVAVPAGSTAVAGGVLHLDPVKWWLVVAGPVLHLAALAAAAGLPNARLHFGVGEFFTALTSAPIRSLVGGRRRFAAEDAERADFCRFCAAHPNPLNHDALIDLVDDPSFDVRVEAVRALGAARSPAAAQRLRQVLAEDDDLADHAAWALGELGDRAAGPLLLARLDPAQTPRVRAQAARALGKLADRTAEPALLAVLATSAPSLVIAATLRGLLDLGGRAHAGIALDALSRLPSARDRFETLDALCGWLDLPNRWLLDGDRDDLPRDLLARAAARHRRDAATVALIGRIQARDPAAVADAFHAVLATSAQDPVLAALGERLDRQHWSIFCVLAGAWLVFRRTA